MTILIIVYNKYIIINLYIRIYIININNCLYSLLVFILKMELDLRPFLLKT